MLLFLLIFALQLTDFQVSRSFMSLSTVEGGVVTRLHKQLQLPSQAWARQKTPGGVAMGQGEASQLCGL